MGEELQRPQSNEGRESAMGEELQRSLTSTETAVPKRESAMGEELQRPQSNEGWMRFWVSLGTSWRTEPEIRQERQQFLTERLALVPDIKRGIYPFRGDDGSMKLSRADVEWLLATHASGEGPVIWEDPAQRSRTGLDLRGADLSDTNLSRLPLARLRGGLEPSEATAEEITPSQYLDKAAIRLSRADLEGTHLEGSHLAHAFLDQAILIRAHLEQADLRRAHLEQADLTTADLGAADLREIFFDAATILDRVRLGDRRRGFARLANVHWNGVTITKIRWAEVDMLGGERVARYWRRTREAGAG